MLAALLPDRAIIRASGADARRFLHGLVTADIEHMIAATPRYAALLTPQGKIIADFLVLQADDAAGENFLIDCPRALAGTLAARLGFYKLRAKVAIEDLGEAAGALALWNGAPAPSSLPSPDFGPCIADPRLPALGWRAIGPPARAAEAADALGAQIVEAAAYDSHRIALGIPSGGRDFAFGDAFPHEANMDQLHGVDFSKGCYVGQEVVSRMQHRGAARSRVVPVALLDGVAPDAGSPVTAGEKAVGAMGSAADGRGLALLRLDRVADALAAGLPLVAGGLRIAPLKPDWATFPWPLAAQTAERTPPR